MSCFLDRLDSSQKPGHRCRCLRLAGYLEHVLPFGATWLWASIKLFQKFNGSFVCFYDILVMTFYNFMFFLESLWWGANAGGYCRLRFCPWMLIASLQLSYSSSSMWGGWMPQAAWLLNDTADVPQSLWPGPQWFRLANLAISVAAQWKVQT